MIIEASPGEAIWDAAERAVEAAYKRPDIQHCLVFNQIKIYLSCQPSVEAIMKAYHYQLRKSRYE